MRGHLIAAVAGAAALSVAALAGRGEPAQQPMQAPSQAPPQAQAPAPDARTVALAPSARAFAPSLRGTRPDGALHVAPDDSVTADAELIAMFDYYLSAVGERSPAQVRAEVERQLDRSLRPAAAAAARRILVRYLAYKRALATLDGGRGPAGPDAAALARRLDALASLRARFFSPAEIAAIFGRDDAANADALARLRLRDDPSLSEEEKAARLAALDAGLPPALRAAREVPLQIVRLEEAAARLRAQGAGDDAVFRMRAEALGPDAAGRMADVDQEQAAWRQRVDSYLAQRRGLSDDAARAALRARMFSVDEQRRLPAYESGQM